MYNLYKFVQTILNFMLAHVVLFTFICQHFQSALAALMLLMFMIDDAHLQPSGFFTRFALKNDYLHQKNLRDFIKNSAIRDSTVHITRFITNRYLCFCTNMQIWYIHVE